MELADDRTICVGKKRVARLMRQLGIAGVAAKRRPKGRPSGMEAPAAPDLVKLDLTATALDQLWMADITCCRRGRPPFFVSVVIDAFSRTCVGWSMRDALQGDVLADALGMAATRRRPRAGVVHHSDSEYVPAGFPAWSDPHSDRREMMCGAVCPRGA